MTKEERQLLLLDICMRLPYGVKVRVGKYGGPTEIWNIGILELGTYNRAFYNNGLNNDHYSIERIKPYLRPLTSLTKEERQEIGVVIQKDCPAPYGEIKPEGVDNLLMASTIGATNLIDWFCAHHFDYRGLIGKGLALEALRGMYDNSNKKQL